MTRVIYKFDQKSTGFQRLTWRLLLERLATDAIVVGSNPIFGIFLFLRRRNFKSTCERSEQYQSNGSYVVSLQSMFFKFAPRSWQLSQKSRFCRIKGDFYRIKSDRQKSDLIIGIVNFTEPCWFHKMAVRELSRAIYDHLVKNFGHRTKKFLVLWFGLWNNYNNVIK